MYTPAGETEHWSHRRRRRPGRLDQSRACAGAPTDPSECQFFNPKPEQYSFPLLITRPQAFADSVLVLFKEASLTVPVDVIPWPVDRKERVSVNCFGVGGTNAHVCPFYPLELFSDSSK